MRKLRVIIVRIQRATRSFLAVNRARKEALNRKWNLITEFNDENPEQYTHLVIGEKLYKVHANKIGPYTKNKYISRYMKQMLDNYLRERRNFDFMTADVAKKFKRNFSFWHMQSYVKFQSREFSIGLPKGPEFLLFRNTDTFKQFIVDANAFLFLYQTLY